MENLKNNFIYKKQQNFNEFSVVLWTKTGFLTHNTNIFQKMITLCLLFLLLGLTIENEYLYYGVALDDYCLNNRVGNLNIQALDLQSSLSYDLNLYTVNVSYIDPDDIILGDQKRCLAYSFHQLQQPLQDGILITMDKMMNYTVRRTTNKGRQYFSFSFPQSQIDKTCSQSLDDSQTVFRCYFYFSFDLQKVSQLSYIFDICIQIYATQSGVSFQSSVISSEQTGKFQPAQTVPSTLLFCDGPSCLNTSKNLSDLTLNNNSLVYVKHEVPSSNSTQQFNSKITFETPTGLITPQQNVVKIVDQKQGSTIFQLQIPTYDSSVKIFSTGILPSLSSARIIQDENTSVQRQSGNDIIQVVSDSVLINQGQLQNQQLQNQQLQNQQLQNQVQIQQKPTIQSTPSHVLPIFPKDKNLFSSSSQLFNIIVLVNLLFTL